MRIASPDPSDTEDTEDPFSAGSDGTVGSSEDEDPRENAAINLRSLSSDASNPSGPLAYPFAKSLADLRATSRPGLQSQTRERSPQEAEASSSRPHYDVDDFKRLLLTGEKAIPGASGLAAPTVSFQNQHSLGDSSSNTDASSISRQSIFEPATGHSQESPKTSHEGSPLDDDGLQKIEFQPPNLLKTKPSMPKHRHGKIVKPNAPLTVSFEDPSLSFSSSNATPNSPGTHIDKPLPPLPSTSSTIRSSIGDVVLKPDPTSTIGDAPSSSSVSHRTAPLPPLSRRHSQLKSETYSSPERSRSTSEKTMSASVTLSPTPPAVIGKAPPPPLPPSRRAAGIVRVNSSSSASTNASVLGIQYHTDNGTVTSQSSQSSLPTLPNPSSSPSSGRQQPQPSSGSPIIPPPPPRRRGSSQSSYAPSRLSGDYRNTVTDRVRSNSGASSISHIHMTPMTATPSVKSRDVMADLSTLQREVDELREKFKG